MSLEGGEVYVVESGRRARKIAADVSDPRPGIITVAAGFGDGAWVLDVLACPGDVLVGRAFELPGPSREVKDGTLARAFPLVVDGGRGRAVVPVEESADLPRVLRGAGQDLTALFALALELLACANETLDAYRYEETCREAARLRARA